jgi:hypothetical protein
MIKPNNGYVSQPLVADGTLVLNITEYQIPEREQAQIDP